MPSVPKKTSSAADQRLLAFLQKRGQPGVEPLTEVREWAAREGLSLVEALERKGLIREEELAEILARDLRLPLLNLPTLSVDDATVKLLNEQTASQSLIMPIRSEGQVLILAMANPFDLEVVKKIEFSTGRQIRPAVALRSHIKDAIDHYYRFDTSLRTLLADVPDASMSVVGDKKTDDVDAKSLSRSADEAPIVKMVNLILGEAVKNKASDIHIEPGPNVTLVRYRINGILEDALQVPKWVHSPVVARLKVMAHLDITERRVPQDGNLRVRFNDRLVDLRVSSLPTNYGEKIVMRVLDPTVALRRLEEIGLDGRDARVLRAAIEKPEGMILVTGPTGSGKTTTLYAVIQEILGPDVNIVTIENPIEYEVKGISQVQINEKQGLTFAGALRSILRQDPDVILVGEIRDRETAEIAFQAAQTGHLVLSTLHTNDTVSTLTRLIDLGIEPYLAASSLLAIVAQRLVRTNCPKCSQPVELPEEARRTFKLPAEGDFRRGKGCPVCRNSGFAGRTGLYEILEVTERLKGLIESKAPEQNVRQTARKEGMTSLAENAADKITRGLTSPDEAMRVVQVEKQGLHCPQCRHAIEETFTVCPYCLHQLQITCASCEAPQKPEWKSCPYCGETQRKKGPEPEAPPVQEPEPIELTTPEPAAAAAPAANPRPGAERPEIGSVDVPHILVVDDNEDLRKVIKLSLERGQSPMRVAGAANGFEALGMVEVERPHLIILDIMMPGMDGFEVCRRLRENLRTAFIPIIMLTAREDADAKLEGFRVGTDDYLVKPFNRAELLARALRLLERTYGYRPPEPAAVAEARPASSQAS